MCMIYLQLNLNNLFKHQSAQLFKVNISFFSFFTVRWEIATKSVIFGQDARLTCHSYACSQGSLKKWFGGKRYDLLCLDGTCNPAYPAKYEMVSRESDYQFDLTIKNISLTDTDCIYTCACGFLKYTNMLVFDDFNFTCKFCNVITNCFYHYRKLNFYKTLSLFYRQRQHRQDVSRS